MGRRGAGGSGDLGGRRTAGVAGTIPDMPDTSPITIDPEVQAGTPCFTGTRVPVRSLFDAIKRGRSLDYFL